MEKEAVLRNFCRNILSKTLPEKTAIDRCLKNEASLNGHIRKNVQD